MDKTMFNRSLCIFQRGNIDIVKNSGLNPR